MPFTLLNIFAVSRPFFRVGRGARLFSIFLICIATTHLFAAESKPTKSHKVLLVSSPTNSYPCLFGPHDTPSKDSLPKASIALDSLSGSRLDSLLLVMVTVPCSLSIKAIITAGADINTTDTFGSTPLCKAIEYANTPAVNLLLSAGAQANLTDKRGVSPLMQALIRHDMNILEALLSHGANAAGFDPDGFPLLFWPIRSNDSLVTAIMLRYGASAYQTDKDGRTALMIAAGSGNPGIVSMLLSYGAQCDMTDMNGRHALFYAVERRDPRVVSLLLNAHCSTTLTDRNNISPLRIAMQMGANQIVSLLIAQGADGYTPLMAACRDNNPARVDSCLTNGLGQLEKRNTYGSTALIIAASIGSYPIVRQLISYGANVNAQNQVLGSALIYAVSAHNVDMVKLLLENGAHPDLPGVTGESPRSMATKSSDRQLLDLLDNKGFR